MVRLNWRFWKAQSVRHSKVVYVKDRTTTNRMDVTHIEIEADAPYDELLKKAKEQMDG